MVHRYPLLIDPQGIASSWIKAKEKENNLRVIRFSDDKNLNNIEASLDVGCPILLENVEADLNAISLNSLFTKGLLYPIS